MKKYALIIGVSEYQSPHLTKLSKAATDAEELAKMLATYGNYEVERLPKTWNQETESWEIANENVTKDEIIAALKTLLWERGSNSEVLIYFAGHGIRVLDDLDEFKGFLAASDCQILKNKKIVKQENGIDLHTINRLIAHQKCRVSSLVMLLDCCHSGSLLENEQVRDKLTIFNSKQDCYLISACRQFENARSKKGEKNSIFTGALLKGLSPENADENGEVSCELVFNVIHKELKDSGQEAIRMGLGRSITIVQHSQVQFKKRINSTKMRMIFQAPPLPAYFVERPEVSLQLKQLLLSEETTKVGTLMISAIYGLGGIGKSVLATALAHDQDVQSYFPDGIFWATLGQQPDILSFLHGWIQALGDYDFKPISVDAASLQLRTLLADKKALLVVDDVWNPDDVEPFRIAGDGCQVLVTTREAPVREVVRYDLDIMTEEQSLALLTACLINELTSEEIEQAKTLAKTVGYLPLALELAAAQIGDGIFWHELLTDLQGEIAYLEILDRLEAEDAVSEEKRKKYSLIASFNLSLKRLSPQRLKRFAWLGVLPDDVNITEKMATTLWDCNEIEAKKSLRYLQSKALLLVGTSSEQTVSYRLHDLLHDLARNLLQSNPKTENDWQLSGLGLSIAQAHQQLLNRYQKKTNNGLWHTLDDDGYIYNQLIWHFEKAEKIEEIHQLLKEETLEGHNGWYSQCEKEGKTAIFVKDVSKAWKIAEENFDNHSTQSISLQYRYALITTSLNSLAGNIQPRLIAALIDKGIWTPAQGLAYVRQNQDAKKQVEGLKAIVKYLPTSLLTSALEIARAIRNEGDQASALQALAPHLPKILPEALEAARAITDEFSRARALQALAPHLPEILPEALEAARAITSEFSRARALQALAPHLPEILPEALEAARALTDQSDRARALQALAPHLPEILPEALEAARALTDQSDRASALQALVKILENINVDLSLWKKILHYLASLNRPYFLITLPSLAPVIIKLGGIEALKEIVKTINDVARYWK